MNSMTAFARTSKAFEDVTITWEIKSVNHRYLETYFRLPELLKLVDPMAREYCRKELARGKLDLACTYQIASGDKSMSLNEALVNDLKALSQQVAPEQPVDPLKILSWPGVLQSAELDQEDVANKAKEVLKLAVDELKASRLREGEVIKQLLVDRCAKMRGEVAKVVEVMPSLLDAQRERIKTKIEEAQAQIDPERLEAEIVLITQKADVDEEIDRLYAHLDEVERVIKTKGPVGRRLDFLMQELNREANTLSSKSLSAVTTQVAVELKVLIEQMREQIQNVE